MAELIDEDYQQNLDAKNEEIKRLESRVNFLKTNRCTLLKKFGPVGDIETSMKTELNISRLAVSISRLDINAAWDCINSMKKERLKKEIAKKQSQINRVQDLDSRQNKSSQELPKFGDALMLYSDDYLKKEIEEITEKGREVENKIRSVIPKKKAPVSAENGVSEDLRGLKEFWMSVKFNEILAREQEECLNKEIHEKIELSKRKIAFIDHSF